MATFLSGVKEWWPVILPIVCGAGLAGARILYLVFPTRKEYNALVMRVTLIESGNITDKARHEKKSRLLAEIREKLKLLDTTK